MFHLPRLPKTRRIASVMLFVWLSAAFTSWANACLVHGPAAMSGGPAHQSTASGAHGVDPDDGASTSDLALTLCEGFCEAERSTVPKAQAPKGPGDAGAADLFLAAAGPAVPAFARRQPGPRWRPLAIPPPPGPPVAIVFLRLTR